MPDTLITADILLRAYAAGLFPMAESADDPELFWIEPQERGVIPLDRFHVSSRLARTVLSDCYEVRIDTDFNAVIAGCAASSPGREETWINQRIKDLYGELFELGQCHTVEVWRDNKLVGGLYGLELGGAFFGESMFHKERDASKVALVHLVARLVKGEYTLLDTQFVTPHLASFGAIEITRDDYMQELNAALKTNGNWWIWEKKQQISGCEVMEILRS